jgi:HSP20 family protein
MLPMLRNRLIPALSDQSLLGQWRDVRREIDRLFDDVVSGTFVGSSWLPTMDLEESENAVRLTFEVPGVSPENLSLTLENGVLTVSGEKRSEREAQGEAGGPTAFERQYGRFERSVVLPQTVDVDNVSAHCENGVLTVELPKRAEARPRRIEIDLGSEKKQLRSGKGEKRDAA